MITQFRTATILWDRNGFAHIYLTVGIGQFCNIDFGNNQIAVVLNYKPDKFANVNLGLRISFIA